MGFNNLYGPNGAAEIDRITGFLSARIPPAEAARRLHGGAKEIVDLRATPVKDVRGNGDDTANAIGAFHGTADPLEQLRQLFRVIYQVRCNLLHGQKSPTADRDQQLCACSAPIIAAVVAHTA